MELVLFLWIIILSETINSLSHGHGIIALFRRNTITIYLQKIVMVVLSIVVISYRLHMILTFYTYDFINILIFMLNLTILMFDFFLFYDIILAAVVNIIYIRRASSDGLTNFYFILLCIDFIIFLVMVFFNSNLLIKAIIWFQIIFIGYAIFILFFVFKN